MVQELSVVFQTANMQVESTGTSYVLTSCTVGSHLS